MRSCVFALLLVLGCDEPMPGRGSSGAGAADLALEGLTEPVRGTITGEEFEAVDAYFRAFRLGDAARVDLVFADVVQEDCGLPLPREGRRVFVRFAGSRELPEERVVVEREGDADVSVHYERTVDERWIGVGSGVAQIVFDEVGRSRARGRLDVHFDDGEESGVRGAFEARLCTSRLGGDLPREGAGLAGSEEVPTPPSEGIAR